MKNLLAFIQRFSHWILFLLLEVVSLSLLFSYNGYQGSVWFSSANNINGVMYECSSFFSNFFSQSTINNELTQRIIALRDENQLLREKLGDDAVKKHLASRESQPPAYSYISAKVISNTITEKNNIMTLDKGYDDGIREDMGVVDANGVVGIVYLVSDNYCTVLSVLNSHTRISCMIRDRGSFGTLHWDAKQYDTANLEDIPRHTQFKLGDKVVTSGYSTIFPRGIPVGKIIGASNSSDGLSYRLKVLLTTDFSHLRDVRVIKSNASHERKILEEISTDSLTVSPDSDN